MLKEQLLEWVEKVVQAQEEKGAESFVDCSQMIEDVTAILLRAFNK